MPLGDIFHSVLVLFLPDMLLLSLTEKKQLYKIICKTLDEVSKV